LKFVDFPFARGADGTQLLYPNDPRISPEFLYFLLDAIDLSNYFYARHFKFLKAQEVRIPPEHLIREFTEFAKEAMRKVSVLIRYNRMLCMARDLLLPRVMDGKLSV
jgi:type I restriction enzyme, S subunit